MRAFWSVVVLLIVFPLFGCGPPYLRTETAWDHVRGFRIDDEAEIIDTPENREVVDILLNYREAIVSKDVGALKRMIAIDYYENAGTTDTTKDDYGAEQLGEIFELVANHATQIRYDVVLKDLYIDGDDAHIDYEYRYAYRYEVGEEQTWDAGIEVNRIILQDRDGEWKIVSGL